MTDEQLKVFCARWCSRMLDSGASRDEIRAAVRAEVERAREHGLSPSDAAHVGKYFLPNEQGDYPGDMHTAFGCSAKVFSDLAGMRLDERRDANGQRVLSWVDRPNRTATFSVTDPLSGVLAALPHLPALEPIHLVAHMVTHAIWALGDGPRPLVPNGYASRLRDAPRRTNSVAGGPGARPHRRGCERATIRNRAAPPHRTGDGREMGRGRSPSVRARVPQRRSACRCSSPCASGSSSDRNSSARGQSRRPGGRISLQQFRSFTAP